MEKIKVNKEVFESLNYIFEEGNFSNFKDSEGNLNKNSLLKSQARTLINLDSWRKEVAAINNLGLYDLALILEHGYELEKTPEQELLEIYRMENLSDRDKGINLGIEVTLKKLNIKIKGINE